MMETFIGSNINIGEFVTITPLNEIPVVGDLYSLKPDTLMRGILPKSCFKNSLRTLRLLKRKKLDVSYVEGIGLRQIMREGGTPFSFCFFHAWNRVVVNGEAYYFDLTETVRLSMVSDDTYYYKVFESDDQEELATYVRGKGREKTWMLLHGQDI